jgi:hypothetical protein
MMDGFFRLSIARDSDGKLGYEIGYFWVGVFLALTALSLGWGISLIDWQGEPAKPLIRREAA